MQIRKNNVGIVVISCALILVAIWFYTAIGSYPNIPTGKFQAVFLDNNQVYFGKLSEDRGEYMTLTQVYYLRDSGVNDSGINLVKLGGEFHGPEDKMYIPKDKILFWENLSDTSPVVKAITTTRK